MAESDRHSTDLPLGPALLAANAGVGWLLYVHVHTTAGIALWVLAALLAFSLLADASRSVTTAVRRSMGMDRDG